MRYPLVTPLASRDGSTDKDEKLVNAYAEVDKETQETSVFKRAGIDQGDAIIAGNDIYGQGLFNYDGYLFAVIDDILGYWIYVGGQQGGATYIGFGAVGTWDNSTSYDVGDQVVYNGQIYYNHIPGAGVTPGSNAYTWQTDAPTGSYYATFAGYTGATCGSKSAAGYSASLAYPYNSYANRHPSSGAWAVFAYIQGNDVMAQQYVDLTDFGIADYGNVTTI